MRYITLSCLLPVALVLAAPAQPQATKPASTSLIQPREFMIPMPDGVKLAADLYFPADMKAGDKMPVLLEYLPYRKYDGRGANYRTYSYFIDRGYVVARVDIRGTGTSEGRLIPYEYSDIELDDGEAVIAWLAKQKWSNGNVGMFGTSWGGFNSIQMAVRQPPALKAFVALMATEALYQEDVHYMDGIICTDSWLFSNEMLNSLPGAPEFRFDEDWLRNRFEVEPSIFTYMRNQRDGAFWDRASSLDKYDKIKAAGFHIGGWYDGYRNSLPRMLENVKAPVKALIGPYDHGGPNVMYPGPNMEWRHEAVRWFDHWLKGIDTGIMDEPPFAVYVRDWHAPGDDLETAPGYWRWEDGWPIERIKTKILYATPDHALSASPADQATHSHVYKPSMGVEGGGPVMWWGSLPPDQQKMDDDCLVYDSDPLEAPLEILGFPKALLNVSADASRANWIVRISDVAPDGTVTLVDGAAMNGTHRKSAREPEDLVPGEVYPLDIDMQFTSWTFPKGHRIRLAVSNAQWPMFWPSPYQMTTTLALGGETGARIELPVVPPGKRPVPKFKAPVKSPALPGYGGVASGTQSGFAEITTIQRDKDTGEAFGYAADKSSHRYPWGVEHYEERIEYRTSVLNPAETSVIGVYSLVYELKDRTIRSDQKVVFKSDLENFRLTLERKLAVDGELKHEKTWDEVIPRDFQ